jgi:hypothetical protein
VNVGNGLGIFGMKGLGMTGQGTAGNVISALVSFVYPGLGQLLQGRLLAAAIFFVAATVLWCVLLGWVMHIWATIDAARYRSPFVNRFL